MSAFDKIIGYKSVKNELLQIIDVIKNREIYDNLGAKLTKGVLLHGIPGLGKTLIANAFIEESGLKAYTIRRNKGNDDFIALITNTFEEAKKNAPCIIFLDDMDKFANEDGDHPDAQEYVAVQSGIDNVKGYDVFVIATTNNVRKLPDSLIRFGRFDRRIDLKPPTDEDTKKIIRFYLKDKKISKDIDIEDLAKMMSYSSCADLETVLNEASIHAGYFRKKAVDMEDIVYAVLRKQYNTPDNYERKSAEDLKRTAIHEAGHTVVAEILNEGSIGLVSLRSSGNDDRGGFIHRCKEDKLWYYDMIVGLAGKAAVELYYAESVADGCETDMEKVYKYIRYHVVESGSCGLSHVGHYDWQYWGPEDSTVSVSDAVIHAEMERYYLKAKEIIIKNREFFENIVDMLMLKETLVQSDIKKIRENVKIEEVAA